MSRCRGFTLIEVVIVLAIIAISLGMAAPRIGAGFSRLDLLQAEGTIRNFIKLGRLEAQRQDRGHYLVLDPERRSVALLKPDLTVMREEALPASIAFVDLATTTTALYIASSGIIRGEPIRLRSRSAEVEIGLR